jgi:hypothetical protein
MKKIELLIGDFEYSQIEEIFQNEKDFLPVNEKDFVIIKALKQIINPNNLIEKDVGGTADTEQVIYKKVKEPEDKSLDTGNVNFKL